MSYLREHGTRVTPQSQPIPGSAQVPNSAGGYAFAVDKWERLERFLILGSEGGTFYVGEHDLTNENVSALRECLAEDGVRTVGAIVAVSTSGRAPKNTEAIFALAMACGWADSEETRRAALDAIPAVCRIGTHLFQFCGFVEQFRGWGRGLKRGVSAWYEDRDVDSLAYQMVKYRSREGWTHRDVLRSCHPGAPSDASPEFGARKALYDFACGRLDGAAEAPTRHVEAFIRAQKSSSPKETAALITEYGNALPREALLTEHMGPEAWAALLNEGMPMTALIRNLGNLSRHGVLTPMSDAAKLVTEQLADGERIRKARVHPLAILSAMKVYESGTGVRGSGTWTTVPSVVDALDAAFYTAFENVEPTGKRILIGIDVSSSMAFHPMAGVPGVTPALGATAMALVTAATEETYFIHGFTTGFKSLPITPQMRLTDACRYTHQINFGGTDCALPMTWALQNGVLADAFIVYTDNETWAGAIHPVQALRRYREQTGIAARLIVVGMTSNGFSIADPDDAGMLDVVGFDTATPAVLADFIRT